MVTQASTYYPYPAEEYMYISHVKVYRTNLYIHNPADLSIWKHEPFSSSDWREWVGTQARNCRRSHDRYLRDTLHIRPEMDEMRALQRSTEHLFVRALDRMEGNYTQRLTDTLRETTTAFRGEISELRAALRRLGQSSSPARRDGDPPSSHIHAYNTHAHGYENNHNHSHNQGQGMPIQGNQHQGSGAWMFAHGGESSNNGRHITNDIGMDVFAGAGGAARLSTDNPLNFNSTENTNNLDMYTNIGADPLDFGTDSHTNTTTAHTNTADTDEFGLNLNTNIRVHRRATVDAGTQTNDTDAQSNAGETGEGIDNDAQTHTDTHTQTPDIHTQTPDIHTQTPDTHAQSPDAEAEDMPQAIEYIPPELPSSPEFNAELMSTPLPAPSSLMLLPPIDPRYMTTLSEPVPYGSVESASGISLDSATKDPDGDEHGDAYSDGVGEDASISMDVEATEPYEGEPSATEMVDSRPKTSQERHTRRSKRQEGARANGDAAINGHAPVNGDAAINGHAPAKGTNGCGGGLALEMPGAVEGVSARKFGTTTLRIVHSGKRRLREHSHRGVAPTANTCKKRRTDKVRDHGDRNGVELESELEGDAGPPTPVVAGTKTHKKKQRNDNLLVKNHKSNFRAILRYTPTMEAQLAHRLDEMTEKNVKRYSRYKATFEFVKIVAHVHHAYVHQISVEDAEIKAAADEDERGAMERALVKHMNSMEGKEIDGVRQTALLIMDRVLGCATVEDAESRGSDDQHDQADGTADFRRGVRGAPKWMMRKLGKCPSRDSPCLKKKQNGQCGTDGVCSIIGRTTMNRISIVHLNAMVGGQAESSADYGPSARVHQGRKLGICPV
ncbi:hypothetical protein SARC_05417 [Sphaeroforma arctica JP610]|uniref:Uncharacterized protein n=1 Tax=Sphaeroforma arctica JP610 TaxID=667725 RepID=A0A0L0G277_9EUKA|nr:hypothetical protein SARC_05417 [Sphaeroforma arctica JP610]KNC82298.1 hypothetical protein SARC_05417 [Sphaeroforma arctica JP610]|eukprot:XP_014156200.1 hypothetical protein SARC_05417 [Sphaeroforma arctica JP610]